MRRILFSAIVTATISFLAILYFSNLNFPVEAQSLPGGGVSVTPAPTASPAPSPTAAPTFPSTGNVANVTIYNTEFDNGNSGTSKTIDWTANGSDQKVTITGACTFTFTAPPGPAKGLRLKLKHEASATTYALTWPACVLGTSGVCWPGGVAGANTNTSGAVDDMFCDYDGANYLCTLTVNFS